MLVRVLVRVLVLAFMCAGGPVPDADPACARSLKEPQRGAARYACPMDPEVKSAKPGKCPKCGMVLRLVPEEVDAPASPDTKTASPAFGDPFSFSSSRVPDVAVYDQNGSRLSFYSDLVKGKTVAINFIFTTCTTICPPLTITFRRVQQEMLKRSLPVQLISISVDPTIDTPERLHDFAAKFEAAPGWSFVTGDKATIDKLLQALGAAVGNKNDHTPMILIGNDVTGHWTRSYGLSSPTALLKVISEAAGRK